MKNPNKKTNKADSSSVEISASFLKPDLVKDIVERLADRPYDTGYCLKKVQVGWHAIESSSIQANACGDISLSSEEVFHDIPFTACFLFTCIKAKGQNYKYTWACSLS